MAAEHDIASAEAGGSLTGSKRQILDHLKRVDTAAVTELAATVEVTTTAVRQHLDALESGGLVQRVEPHTTGSRGRPASRWALAPSAAAFFPDRHQDLTVELIAAIGEALGPEGLSRVIDARTEHQRQSYVAALGDEPDLARRLEHLAERRIAEGYLAELHEGPDGSFDLVEHHCPICEAATACSQLCRDELALFRDVLGEAADVERTTHLLSGDGRCSYRITPVSIG